MTATSAAAAACRGAGDPASSASISAPTRTAPTASRDYELGVTRFARHAAISPSTSPRPTRRACATCRRAKAWLSCLSRVGGRARREAGSSAARRRSSSRSRPTWTRPTWRTSPPRCRKRHRGRDRLQHDHLAPAASQRATRTRPAVFRASRCSSARPSCWPRCAGCSARMSHHRRPAASNSTDTRPGEDPRRRRSGAALYRHDLCRAGLPARIVDRHGPLRRGGGHSSLREIRGTPARPTGPTAQLDGRRSAGEGRAHVPRHDRKQAQGRARSGTRAAPPTGRDCRSGRTARATRRRPRSDSSIMLRMSRDQVAPMKTPSIW